MCCPLGQKLAVLISHQRNHKPQASNKSRVTCLIDEGKGFYNQSWSHLIWAYIIKLFTIAIKCKKQVGLSTVVTGQILMEHHVLGTNTGKQLP